jgi:hypothetical protein
MEEPASMPIGSTILVRFDESLVHVLALALLRFWFRHSVDMALAFRRNLERLNFLPLAHSQAILIIDRQRRAARAVQIRGR